MLNIFLSNLQIYFIFFFREMIFVCGGVVGVVVGDEDADADATADADVGVHSNEHVQQRWLRPVFLFSSSEREKCFN